MTLITEDNCVSHGEEVERIFRIIQKIKYKPNFKINLRIDCNKRLSQEKPNISYIIQLVIKTKDRDLDIEITLSTYMMFNMEEVMLYRGYHKSTEAQIITNIIGQQILDFEIHEFEEYLKYDDERVKDPHEKDNK